MRANVNTDCRQCSVQIYTMFRFLLFVFRFWIVYKLQKCSVFDSVQIAEVMFSVQCISWAVFWLLKIIFSLWAVFRFLDFEHCTILRKWPDFWQYLNYGQCSDFGHWCCNLDNVQSLKQFRVWAVLSFRHSSDFE